ncbi:MAG: hypothetical protein HZA04_09330 [Nitrospinae bacterium]|nr:hypothetical protein [Nitrospinota bacterium]
MSFPPPLISREAILDAIKRFTKEHGHPPSIRDFYSKYKIDLRDINQFFDNWNQAVQTAGYKPNTGNVRAEDNELLRDWGKAVRHCGKAPTVFQYGKVGHYDVTTIRRRFGNWRDMPQKFREFAEGTPEWKDVIDLLPTASANPEGYISEDREDEKEPAHKTAHTRLSNRTTYGPPLNFRGLRHEPVNENGVILLFGMVAKELGYYVEAVQSAFPDCEAKRDTGNGKWQSVRIEFEFESRNFKEHGHSSSECDVIVCWRHNWKDCPQNIEVVELKKSIVALK